MKVKKKSAKVAALLVVALTAIALNSVPASAKTNLVEGSDSAAILYNPLQVNSISLRMSSSDFESLKYPNVSWNNEGDWRQTTMSAVVAGKTYGPFVVGVHLKGAWGSWRDVTGKAAFKVKMDAFVPGQKFFGVSKLTLNNMVQDPSMIHEFMTYKLMREVGVPAPRTGYMNVSVNGINYGLHLNVETVGKTMLARWGITSDHIYKGSLPNFPDFYPGSQNMFTVESGSPPNRDDLANFMSINKLEGETWWAQISQKTEMDKLTLQWATEIYATHWDGYLMNKNNYFVNFDKEGKVLMISWGTDQTWGGAPGYFGFNTLLPNKCMGSTSCLKSYNKALVKVAFTAQNLRLGQLAQEVANSIYPSVLSDPWVTPSDVQAAQASAIGNQSYRNLEINQLVIPWDTTLSMVAVNSLRFALSDLIYLAPETSSANIRAIPRQPGAVGPSKNIKLKPGLNKTEISIISPDGQTVTAYLVNFYLLTQRQNTSLLSFSSNSATLDARSEAKFSELLTKLANAKTVKFVVKKPLRLSAKISERRIKILEARLKRAGIGSYQISTEKTRLNSNQFLVVTNYQE